MVDAHGIELSRVRNHLDNSLGIFPQPIAIHVANKHAIEDVHPLREVNLSSKGTVQDRSDVRSKVEPLDAFEAKMHQLRKCPGDHFVQIAFNERENTELSWAKGSACRHRLMFFEGGDVLRMIMLISTFFSYKIKIVGVSQVYFEIFFEIQNVIRST